jgi:FkbM family methyltransferase
MSAEMRALLEEVGAAPVLVDVGASLGTPPIWAPIAAASTYVGFDPDSREMSTSAAHGYRKAVIVNEAVTSEPGKSEIGFYLTRTPTCSSTLEPNLEALSNYHFRDLFEVERQATVRAATLDVILARLGLERIDWLKCDSQGTDLRIFRSLGENLRKDVLALDVEPGLIDAYRGEDLFVDTHKHLVANGFWLSRLDVMGAVRVRGATLQAAYPQQQDQAQRSAFAAKSIRSSPGWCEARYLRTLESMAGAARERLALLCVFALLDEQPGFALDVALEFERRFADEGGAALGARLRAAAMAAIARGPRSAPLARLKAWLSRLVG